MTSESPLMFRIVTGEIVKYNECLYHSSGNYLQMYGGWTPYFTNDGVYIGCKTDAYFLAPDKKTFESYWELNR